jgi:hypothetical protein
MNEFVGVAGPWAEHASLASRDPLVEIGRRPRLGPFLVTLDEVDGHPSAHEPGAPGARPGVVGLTTEAGRRASMALAEIRLTDALLRSGGDVLSPASNRARDSDRAVRPRGPPGGAGAP